MIDMQPTKLGVRSYFLCKIAEHLERIANALEEANQENNEARKIASDMTNKLVEEITKQ